MYKAGVKFQITKGNSLINPAERGCSECGENLI